MQPKRSPWPTRVDLDAVHGYAIPQADRVGLLRLDVNEHAGGAPDFVVRAVQEAVTSQALATYPVYAEWHREAAAWYGVRPEQLTCTAGGDEAIKALCEVYLQPDRPLVMPVPGFDLFNLWAQLYGCPLREVQFGADFAFDADAWFSALTGPLSMAVLITPNNPTGTVVPREIVEKTLQTVTCPVVVDETYIEFVGDSAVDLIDKYPHLFVIRSYSKVHGLAGLRIGAVLSQTENIQQLRKVLPPFNVSRLAIAAARAVMQRPDHLAAHVAQIGQTRDHFIREMAALGVRTGPAHANFVLCELGNRAGSAVQALASEGILIRDRSSVHPTLQGWVRIAMGTPGQMARCLAALRKHLAQAPAVRGLLFDMDGPLVDVANSYRVAIVQTARKILTEQGFSDAVIGEVTAERVEILKRRGGLNNDWDCTLALVTELGAQVSRDTVIAEFQQLYWGVAGDGLIAHEPFRVDAAQRARIAGQFATGIVTGRPREEAIFTLKYRDATGLWPAENVVAMEDAPAKPAPDGLWQLAQQLRVHPTECAYLGDSVDDMRAAVAAGMLAIGILPASAMWGDGLAEKLAAAGAWTVFASVEEALTWWQQ